MNRLIVCLIVLIVVIGRDVHSEINAQKATRVLYTKTAFGANLSHSVLPVPDATDHTLVQSFRIDLGRTDSAAFDITQEYVWVQGDSRGSIGTYSGYAMYIMRGGDRVYIRWASDRTPKGTRADGERASESGTIRILNGTGKFGKIQGSGIYRGYAKGPIVEENILDLVF